MGFEHIYLSPHYDDASLSCGGVIHRQTLAGQSALVVTVCADPPPPNEPLSPFAQKIHQQWGNPEDVIATRREEDRVSMGILGVDYLRLHLSDCIYRGQPAQREWYYNNGDELFGQIHPAELALVDEITDTLIKLVPDGDKAVIYGPLTVGNHVDHQLVYAATKQLQRQGWTIAFYEDYPYVDPNYVLRRQTYNLEATLTRLSGANLQPRIETFSEEDLRAKINSVAAYASQIETLFDNPDKMEIQVQSYALQVGKGHPAERLWVPG